MRPKAGGADQQKRGRRREGEHTFGDGDMLKQQDDGSDRELRSKSGDKSRVDIGGSDVLESARNGA